jgi:phosphoribosyl-ATP pyrophosphohydrolase/phosphoribosyl-AMP cyclohydrolase
MKITFNAQGLIPAIVQDNATGAVLMLAYMNQEAIDLTLEKKVAHYYSRSRQKLWLKGETSGHFQKVRSFVLDCDTDTILMKVDQTGVACHTGAYSCFHNPVFDESSETEVIDRLYATIANRQAVPVEGSYTNYLFDKGIDKILKKVGEESAEVIIGAKNSQEELIYEASDLIYHLLVLLVNEQVTLGDIFGELEKRVNHPPLNAIGV